MPIGQGGGLSLLGGDYSSSVILPQLNRARQTSEPEVLPHRPAIAGCRDKRLARIDDESEKLHKRRMMKQWKTTKGPVLLLQVILLTYTNTA